MRVALCQMRAGGDVSANIAQARGLIDEAAAGGAEFIATPEVTNLIAPNAKALFAAIRPEAEDPALEALRAAARAHKIWLLIGSLALREEAEDRAVNRSFLIDPAGEITARYDKIHMFRAELPGGATYDEARNYRPGNRAVLAPTPFGALGLTICYDLRFPALYRALARAGARWMTAPSAFTVPTGEAHWRVLLRARAVECGAFMLAPAQWGRHGMGKDGGFRESYGHSLIVSPWGEVIADAGEGVGVIHADLDMRKVDEARAQIPSLEGARDFEGP